eukprot:UN20385
MRWIHLCIQLHKLLNIWGWSRQSACSQSELKVCWICTRFKPGYSKIDWWAFRKYCTTSTKMAQEEARALETPETCVVCDGFSP